MRTAFCLSGELRSFDKTYTLLEKNILSKFKDYDIFIFMWADDPDVDKMSIMLTSNINVKAFHTEKRQSFNEDLVNEKSTQGMFRQLYCVQQCNKLKQKYEELGNFKYDAVVRIRPDLLLLEDTSLPDDIESYDFSKLWVMNHDDWHGYCDRLYISNSKNIDIISNGFDQLPYYIKIGGTSFYEAFLMFIIHCNDIEVETLHSLKTCLLRTNGDKEGELIHTAKGTLIRKPEGIWHTQYYCYI